MVLGSWSLQGATNPRFQHSRKGLEVKLLNKEPRDYAFDDEVRISNFYCHTIKLNWTVVVIQHSV
jgi:hypothetical protein